MPSPFPGMDPFIEQSGLWGDFYASLLGAMRAELNRRLPEGFVASTELYVWTPQRRTPRLKRPVEPDVYVREEQARPREANAAAAVLAPLKITFPAVEPKKRRFLQIRDSRTKRVVTVIEVLSPANKKPGDDHRQAFLTKRGDYLANGLNLVEIDLLRGGRRAPLGKPPREIPEYYVLVCRAWEYPEAGVWVFTLRDPLPEIPIPIIEDLPDVLLPLRPCLDRAYDEGRYASSLPYGEPLQPRVNREDAAWVKSVLAQRNQRED